MTIRSCRTDYRCFRSNCSIQSRRLLLGNSTVFGGNCHIFSAAGTFRVQRVKKHGYFKRTFAMSNRGQPKMYQEDSNIFYSFPFTLQNLQLLKAVSHTDDREQAAAMLSMTKSNVQMQLSKMEKEMGTALLTSKCKGTRPEFTLAGKLLLRYTDRLMALAMDAMTACKDLDATTSGVMFIGASQTTGTHLLPRLIERFKRKHPEVGVQLQVENTRRCCLAVVDGDVDIAVVGGVIPKDLEHIVQVTPYQIDEVKLIVGKDHPLAGRTEIEKEKLYGLKFVSLFKSSTLQTIISSLEENGIQWRALDVIMEVNSVEAIKNSVEVNLGVAFMSMAAVGKELALGQLHAVSIKGVPLERTLVCVTDPGRYCSKAVRAFIEEMFGVTIETSTEGCFPDYSEGSEGQRVIPSFQEQTLGRYPGLQGRHPDVSDLSDPVWDYGIMSPDSQSDPRSGMPGPTARTSAQKGNLALGERIPFSLAQLVVLRTVARTGGFNSAALALSISQPAVSKSISTLEQVFGQALVQRAAGGGMTWLTEAGLAVLPYVESILSVAGEAVRAVEDAASANTGVVSLGASQSVGTYLMPRLIAGFRRAHPSLNVQLQVDKSRKMCDLVDKGDIDLAIIGGDAPAELQHVLRVVPYAQDELVLIVPPNHELTVGGSCAQADLRQLSFVSLNSGNTVQSAQEHTLRQHGILWRNLEITMEFDSIEAIKGAVQHGLGCAFVSVSAIEKELELGLVARISIAGLRLARTLDIVTNPRRPLPLAAQKFMDEILAIGPGAGAGLDKPGVSSVLPIRRPTPRPWELRSRAGAGGGSGTARNGGAGTAAAAGSSHAGQGRTASVVAAAGAAAAAAAPATAGSSRSGSVRPVERCGAASESRRNGVSGKAMNGAEASPGKAIAAAPAEPATSAAAPGSGSSLKNGGGSKRPDREGKKKL